MLPRLVLFGVGNPGPRYVSTRHNVGLAALDALAGAYGVRWREGGHNHAWGRATIHSCSLTLIRPKTYVNLSGQAIREFSIGGEIDPAGLLVLVDDIALPFGQLRLRRRGSDGGHNGLRSIIEAIGTKDFPRLRMGVGPVPPDEDAADFVLEPLTGKYVARARALVERAVSCVSDLVATGFDRTMSLYNADEPSSESD